MPFLKRIFLLLFLISTGYASYSQCQICCYDPNCAFTSLICSGSSTQACVGVPYSNVLTIAVPTSYTDPGSGTAYTIVKAKVDNISGMPAGIIYQCNPSNCTISAGSRGCILISGTASTPGTYPTQTIVTVTVQYGLFQIPVKDTISDTFIVQAKDCYGVCGGTASMDNCGICSGGTTGKLPNCDDGDACTTDACGGQGGCTHTQACTVTISGKIQTEIGIAIPGVKVKLTGSKTDSVVTAADGLYSFTVNAGDSAAITPSKNNDTITNKGVTTSDITLIRKHALGTWFDSPYKVIAGDASNSTSSNTADIPYVRAVVLSNTKKFPPNNSRIWEFVSSAQVFSGPPYNPFPFTKTRTYGNIASSFTDQNFIGVKIGDVNNSWEPEP